MALKKSPTVDSLRSDSDSGRSEFDEDYYANKPPIIPIDHARVKSLKEIENLNNFKNLKQHSTTTIIADELVTAQGQGNIDDNNRQVNETSIQKNYNNKENYLSPESLQNQSIPITSIDQLVKATSDPSNSGQSVSTVAVVEVETCRQNNITSANCPIYNEENPRPISESSDNFQHPTIWYQCLSFFTDCLCC